MISSLLFPYRRLILAFRAVSQGLRRLTAARGIGLRYLFENYAFDTDRRELQRGTDAIAIAPSAVAGVMGMACEGVRSTFGGRTAQALNNALPQATARRASQRY